MISGSVSGRCLLSMGKRQVMSTRLTATLTASQDYGQSVGSGAFSSGCHQQSAQKSTKRLPRYSFFGENVGPLQITKALRAGHVFLGSSFSTHAVKGQIPDVAFEHVTRETLSSIAELLEDLQDSGFCEKQFECKLGSDVLTVNFGGEDESFVLSVQKTSSKQIWLTLPQSGVKRFDFVDGVWRCDTNYISLHDMLTMTVTEIVGTKIDFSQCSFGKIIPQGMLMY